MDEGRPISSIFVKIDFHRRGRSLMIAERAGDQSIAVEESAWRSSRHFSSTAPLFLRVVGISFCETSTLAIHRKDHDVTINLAVPLAAEGHLRRCQHVWKRRKE